MEKPYRVWTANFVVVGSYRDKGEASRALRNLGPGAFVTMNGEVLEQHFKSSRAQTALVEQAYREGRLASPGAAPPKPAPSPDEPPPAVIAAAPSPKAPLDEALGRSPGGRALGLTDAEVDAVRAELAVWIAAHGSVGAVATKLGMSTLVVDEVSRGKRRPGGVFAVKVGIAPSGAVEASSKPSPVPPTADEIHAADAQVAARQDVIAETPPVVVDAPPAPERSPADERRATVAPTGDLASVLAAAEARFVEAHPGVNKLRDDLAKAEVWAREQFRAKARELYLLDDTTTQGAE